MFGFRFIVWAWLLAGLFCCLGLVLFVLLWLFALLVFFRIFAFRFWVVSIFGCFAWIWACVSVISGGFGVFLCPGGCGGDCTGIRIRNRLFFCVFGQFLGLMCYCFGSF